MKKQSSKVKLNVQLSPESEKVDKAEHERFKAFSADILAVAQKHGFDSFLVSACKDSKPRALYSTAIGTQDTVEAVGLMFQVQRAVQQMIRAQTPTAPGGIA